MENKKLSWYNSFHCWHCLLRRTRGSKYCRHLKLSKWSKLLIYHAWSVLTENDHRTPNEDSQLNNSNDGAHDLHDFVIQLTRSGASNQIENCMKKKNLQWLQKFACTWYWKTCESEIQSPSHLQVKCDSRNMATIRTRFLVMIGSNNDHWQAHCHDKDIVDIFENLSSSIWFVTLFTTRHVSSWDLQASDWCIWGDPNMLICTLLINVSKQDWRIKQLDPHCTVQEYLFSGNFKDELVRDKLVQDGERPLQYTGHISAMYPP